MRGAGLLVLLMVAGCGGTGTPDPGPGGGVPHVPSVHAIYVDTPAALLPAGTGISYGPFALPSATVSYTVTERTSTVSQDSWDTGILSTTELAYLNAGQASRAYALKSNATGTSSATASVPADDYHLLVFCRNILDDCVFSYQVSATY